VDLRRCEQPGSGDERGLPATCVGNVSSPKTKAVAMAVIDLSFVLVGRTIPLDHGYALFSALSRIVPELHGDRRVGVHPIRGRQSAPGVLSLTERSRLKLRMPAERVAPYLVLAGSALDLDGDRVSVGIPRVEALCPAALLTSRLVTIGRLTDPGPVLESLRAQMAELGIDGTLTLFPSTNPKRAGELTRRVIRIKGKRLVGYAVGVRGLDEQSSVNLQEHGLGSHRRMGCGLFLPSREGDA
jgi:CRISPR-associated protein Cas6